MNQLIETEGLDRLKVEDLMLKETQDKLVEIRQVHAYAQFCLRQQRITEAQYKKVRSSLEDGCFFTAQQDLVKMLAQNEFKQEVIGA